MSGITAFAVTEVLAVDPADEKSADEQMNFGFVTGNGSIPDAYSSATAYPAPEGWTGTVLSYPALSAPNRTEALLLDYLHSLQAHCKKLMAHTSHG